MSAERLRSKIGATDRFDFLQRRVDVFRHPQQGGEAFRAERIGLVRSSALRLQPFGKFLHGLGRRLDGIRQFLLQRLVLHLGERLRHILAIELGEAAETGAAEIDERPRQRQLQVRLDLADCRRHLLDVRDEGAEALLGRRIRRRHIGAGIEAGIEIPRRIGERLARLAQRKQIVVDAAHQVVALEALFRHQVRILETNRLDAHLLQPCDLLLDALGSPVRQLAVEFVTTLRHRERRVGAEIAVDEFIDVLRPLDIHHRRRRFGGADIGFGRAVATRQRSKHRDDANGATQAGRT